MLALPSLQVGWEKVERALAKIKLALQREQYEVAANFLRQVAEQVRPRRGATFSPSVFEATLLCFSRLALTLELFTERFADTCVSWHAEQLVTTDSLVALAMMLGEDRAEVHCKAVAGYEQDMRRWLDDKNEVVDSSEDSEEEERKRQEEEEKLLEEARANSEREVLARTQHSYTYMEKEVCPELVLANHRCF